MSHKTSLKVHLIFCCKYRKTLLRSLGEEVKTLCHRISQPRDFEILTMEVDTDHIHFLIEYEPKVSVTQIVKCLKRETTHRLWEDHEGYLKKQFWNERTFWSDGFFACSIGEASDETIINCRTGATLTPGQLNCCPFCFIGLFDILYVLVYIIIYEAGDKNGKE